jgi:hypothetical protein
MFDAPLMSLSIVIPHSLLLQRRTLLISFSLNLTLAVSLWQQQHSLDVLNSSTSTNSHHLFNFSFISFTGPLRYNAVSWVPPVTEADNHLFGIRFGSLCRDHSKYFVEGFLLKDVGLEFPLSERVDDM